MGASQQSVSVYGNFSENPYSYFRKYLDSLGNQKQRRLDEARRRLTHFWYQAARLVQLGFATPQEVFDSVGPPDILEALEPLEAIRAETIAHDGVCVSRPWPPMNLLIAWYKKREPEKARDLVAEVPARPKLYEAYRKSRSQTEA